MEESWVGLKPTSEIKGDEEQPRKDPVASHCYLLKLKSVVF